MTNIRALPTKQRLNRLDNNDRIIIGITPDMAIKPPTDSVILAIDNGSLWQKIGVIKDPETIIIEKVLNSLAEVPSQLRAKNSSFQLRSKSLAPVKDELTVSYRGKTYTFSQKGATLNGESGLHTDKMDKLILRVLFALTLMGLGNGESVHLSITTFFEQGTFRQQEQKAKRQLGRELTWSTVAGKQNVKLESLQIYPEGYHAAEFPRLQDPNKKSLNGQWVSVLDNGYRTFLNVLIDPNGYFDDARSQSFDGEGTSKFYQWVAEQAGIEEEAENPQFIQAVNSDATTYRPMGSSEEIELGEAIATAEQWYFDHLTELITNSTPTEVERFVLCGGGAYRFGDRLIDEFLWGHNNIRCNDSDIANVTSQLITMAREL